MPSERRIAYVLRAYPVLSETFISSEINALAAEGIPVSVLSLLRSGPGQDSRDHPGVEVVRFDYRSPRCWGHLAWCLLSHPAWTLRGLALAARIASLSPRLGLKGLVLMPKLVAFAARCRRSGVRHVHTHFAGTSAWSAFCVAQFVKCPFSLMFHTLPELDFAPAPWLLRQAQAVLVNSERNLAAIRSRFAQQAGGKLRLVRTGLMFEELAGCDQPAERDAAEVVAIARLVPEKGLDVLVRALGLLAREGLDVRQEASPGSHGASRG